MTVKQLSIIVARTMVYLKVLTMMVTACMSIILSAAGKSLLSQTKLFNSSSLNLTWKKTHGADLTK